MSDDPQGPRRLHPISIVGTGIKALPGAIIGMVGAFGVVAQRNPSLALLIALGVGAALLLGALSSWWFFTYDVRAREIVIQRGLLSRQRRVIPFDRVRDVSIERPLLARLVGTAKMRIETGGAKSDEGVLDMIELAAAHRLRDFIRRSNLLVAEERGAAVDHSEEPSELVIFEMSIGRVLGSGLLNFSLIFIALAFAALQYLEDLGVIDLERFAESGRAQFAGMFTLRTALILIVLLVLLGLVSGVLRTLTRDYGFRLIAGETGLRRRRGLFTLSEVLIPARRTEAARIDTGWLSGFLGWHALSFQTLGAELKEGGVQVAAPFARAEEIRHILIEAGFPLPPTEPMIRPPARALIGRCGPWLSLAVAAALATFLWPEAWWAVPVPLAIAVAAFVAWRRDGHLPGERALFIREGLLRRRLWIIPYEKLQVLVTRRGPLQRPLGLASLLPDTAGASPLGAPAVSDLPQDDAAALAKRLLDDFYASRRRARQAAGRGAAMDVEQERAGA